MVEVKPGHLVWHKEGGPPMTVLSVIPAEYTSEQTVMCGMYLDGLFIQRSMLARELWVLGYRRFGGYFVAVASGFGQTVVVAATDASDVPLDQVAWTELFAQLRGPG